MIIVDLDTPAVVIDLDRMEANIARLQRYLDEHGSRTIADITSHADICSSSSARQAIYALADKVLVHRTDGGGPGSRATYGLTDLGKVAASATQ